MNDKTIKRQVLADARESMGGLASDVREYCGFAAVELDDRRQVAMFAVEVSKQVALFAVDVETELDTVVDLFDSAVDSGASVGILLVFHGWKLTD